MREGHIWIIGLITDDVRDYVYDKLIEYKDYDEIVLHVDSDGGYVSSGYSIYNLLKSSGKKIRTIVETRAKSIATVIALAGNPVEIRKPGEFMIHNPFVPNMTGDADALIKGASELRKMENELAEIYAAKTKLPIERIKEMMKRETSFTAAETVQFGFADRTINSLKIAAIGKSKIQMEEQSTASLFDDFKTKMNSLIDGLFPSAEAQPVQGIEAAPAQPAPAAVALPAGEYPLLDGRVIVVDESGMISEVKGNVMPAPVEPEIEIEAPEAPMPIEDSKEKEMLASIQAQLDEMKKKYEMSEAKAESAIQALGTIKNEFETLRKRTVGSDKAPKAAATFEKTPAPVQEEQYADLKKEIFAINGLNQILNKK